MTDLITLLNTDFPTNGIGEITAATLRAYLTQLVQSMGSLRFAITVVNMNAVGDNAIAIALPAGFTQFRLSSIFIANASGSLTSTVVGLYTSINAGGATIVAGTTLSISTGSLDTNNNLQGLTIVDLGTRALVDQTLYFRVQTGEGSPATADVIVNINPLT